MQYKVSNFISFGVLIIFVPPSVTRVTTLLFKFNCVSTFFNSSTILSVVWGCGKKLVCNYINILIIMTLKPTIIKVQAVTPYRVPAAMAHQVQDNERADSSRDKEGRDEKMASQENEGTGEREASLEEDDEQRDRPPSPAQGAGRTGAKQKKDGSAKS